MAYENEKPVAWCNASYIMKLLTVYLLLLITFSSCNFDSNLDMSEDIVNIQKCAIKYAINPPASPLNSYTSLYFIKIGDSDPSEAILNSLQTEMYNVKKVSDGEFLFDNSHNGIYDKLTGEQGVLITVGKTINSKINDITVTIDVEIFLGILFAEGYRYTLQYNAGSWSVIKVEMTWIS